MASAIGFQIFRPQELDELWSLGRIDDGWHPSRSLGNILRIITSLVDMLDQSTIAYGMIVFVAIFVGRSKNLCGVNTLKNWIGRRATQTRLQAASIGMSRKTAS